MPINKLKLLFLCLLAQTAFAMGESGSFLVVPSANALGEKSFQVRGTLGYHRSTGNAEMDDRFPFVTAFRYGFYNSMDLGVQLGNTVSLDLKSQIRQSYGYIPAVAIGARAFVQSPEAHFYSVPKPERKEQTGEFYTAVEWNTKLWTLLGGVSVFPTMDSNAVAPFWGFEQYFGSKLGLVYEGFFRHGFSHHNIGLAFKPVKALQISAGATEFYRYFLNEDGDFKIRTKNPNARTGYHAPGVYASIAITGGLKKTTSDNELADLRLRLDSLEARINNIDRGRGRERGRLGSKTETDTIAEKSDLQIEFEEIVQGYFVNDLDLDSLRTMEELFINKGLMHKSFVLSEAQNKNADTHNRITAIRIMSHFPDSIFLEPLGNIVADNTNESTAREAAIALGVINTPEARRILLSVVNQTSGIVRKTIIDIIGEL
ncbi:MAG: HEAT repeat domain-containing protein [Fibromonadaceae bacterium]|jgi:hypothetical protein|nr:HEAT repeat domain-containing protein [Fibromonadaceae bacterium]